MEKVEEQNKMKILAFSDIHGDTQKAQELAWKAKKEDVDLVIIAGDVTFNDQWQGGIIGPFLEAGKEVLILGGNHDSFATIDFLSEKYGIKHLHKSSHQKENLGVFGCGGANIGPFKLSEESIFTYLQQAHETIKHLKKRIMVTHVHPAQSIAEKMTSIFPGSTGVLSAIYQLQPDMLICGHVHEAEGIEEKIGNTTIINVGENGKIIQL